MRASDLDICAAVVLFCCLGVGLAAATRNLDRTRAAAVIGAARHADWLARQAARSQMHTFLHDQVLATLTSATRATPEMRPLLARQAQNVCRLMDELADAVDPGSMVMLRQFVDQVAELTMTLDPSATFHADVTDPDGHLDGEAVGAFLGAFHQAMVNSIAHAGADARRTVRLTDGDVGVVLTVTDDGCGFDLRRVPLSRMGLSVSILGRMRSLCRGSAAVDAAPGTGTTVTLRWCSEPSVETREPIQPAISWDISPYCFRLMFGLIAVCQLALGAVVARGSGQQWAVLALGTGFGLAIMVVALAGPGRLPAIQTDLVVAVVLALAAGFVVGRAAGTLGGQDAWFYRGCAIVLLLLCLRGRGAAASVILLLIAPVDLVLLALTGESVRSAVGAVLPSLVFIGTGVPLIVVAGRLQQRAVEARSQEPATSAARAWDRRLRAELKGCSDQIRPLVVPLLERIAAGTPLDAGDIERCLLVEGRLRDTLRGGRLAQEALLDACEAARRRGLEVALIDAAPEEWLSEHALAEIVPWAVAELASAARGPVVVRLHGRSGGGLASVRTPTGTITFGGWNDHADLAALPTLDGPPDGGERYR